MPSDRRHGRALRSAFALALAWLTATALPACGSKSGLPTQAQCASYSAVGELAPLDVFIAMDTSGSMEFATSSGKQKIAEVESALQQFLLDPASAGMGATISFFPQLAPDVPELCSSDLQCKKDGACLPISMCYPSSSGLCHSGADCAGGDTCEPMGRCANDGESFCLLSSGFGCAAEVACEPVGLCENRYVCAPTAYAPALPVAALPDAAPQILAALAAHPPDGGTPTHPALVGMLGAARAHVAKLPERKAIVLLATDGLPTVCDPAIDPIVVDPAAGVPALVATAKQGLSDGVQTFVIGVFAPDEAVDAQANLDEIAVAGGSSAAFVISTAQDVTQSFLATLNQIRREARACDYSLPRPGAGAIEARLLIVSLDVDGTRLTLERRESAEQCDPETGGYYFDKDPSGPTPPGRITLCPASCALTDNGKRDVALEVDCGKNRLVSE